MFVYVLCSDCIIHLTLLCYLILNLFVNLYRMLLLHVDFLHLKFIEYIVHVMSLGSVLKRKFIHQRSTICVNILFNVKRNLIYVKTFNSEITGFFKLRFMCIFCLALTHPRKILLQSKKLILHQMYKKLRLRWISNVFCLFFPFKGRWFSLRMLLQFLFFCSKWINKIQQKPKYESVEHLWCTYLLDLSCLTTWSIWSTSTSC